MPKLALPRLMDEGMFQPVWYCYRTCKDGAVAFRQELIQTSRNWEALGFVGLCLFTLLLSGELALRTKVEYRFFEAAQN